MFEEPLRCVGSRIELWTYFAGGRRAISHSFIFCKFFDGLECVAPSFAFVSHFVFLRDV